MDDFRQMIIFEALSAPPKTIGVLNIRPCQVMSFAVYTDYPGMAFIRVGGMSEKAYQVRLDDLVLALKKEE